MTMRDGVVQFINLLVGVVTCYLSISFIMQTKDDFRFVIPYVEFQKQTKGHRPILLDTSVLIDGRINEIAEHRHHRQPARRATLRARRASGDRRQRGQAASATAGGAGWTCSPSSRTKREKSRLRHYDTHEDSIHDVDERLMTLATGPSARVPDQRLQSQQGCAAPRRGRDQHQRAGQRAQARRAAGREDDRAACSSPAKSRPGRRVPRRRDDGRRRSGPRRT
jgi:hypothetical protein